MRTRLAVCLALAAFAACLIAGAFFGENSFPTVVGRALLAMGFTFVIGLAVGAAAHRMVEESVETEKEKMRNSPKSPGEASR